jgi:hypothetical protein
VAGPLNWLFQNVKLKWWFSVLLGVAYLAVFHLWRMVSPPWIVSTGLTVSMLLTALLIVATRQPYFVNHWDALFHASVILDIVLEATWIERHEHVGFYLCAAAFAVVLIGYRLWSARSRLPQSPRH